MNTQFINPGKLLFPLLIVFIFLSCNSQSTFIPFDNQNLYFEGRILEKQNAAELSWPATSVTIEFEGESVSAIMQDLDTANYYNVIVDGIVTKKFHTDTTEKKYLLASGLDNGKHRVQLFKRTEWDKGKTLFYGFEIPKSAKLKSAKALSERKIEFFGNSITCGYAIEDTSSNDSWFGYFQNAYRSYASITARHFNAQMHSTSKSGIGIMVSWFPLIMPEMYNRLDPLDSSSKWDFKKFTPDIVVINLFQNDSWLVKNHNHEQFIYRFGSKEPGETKIIDAYRNFVSTIRSQYPKAHIICALGNMDATRLGSAWPDYIVKAVKQLNDPKIYTCFFPFKNTAGHPRVSEQQVMADTLINFIEKNIQW